MKKLEISLGAKKQNWRSTNPKIEKTRFMPPELKPIIGSLKQEFIVRKKVIR